MCSKCKFYSADKENKYGISYCELADHKDTYIQYKCTWCCNIAAYHCGGTSYYCMHCHDRKGPAGPKCQGKDDCPLGVEHPPNASNKAFAIGCGMCKELKIKNGEDLQKEFDKQLGDKKKRLEEFQKDQLNF